MTARKDDPFLDAGMRGYITNTARKNFWRVAEWYPFEDLVQDGYLCFYKCRKHYPDLSDIADPTKAQRSWFFSLVKTTYLNHISTLAAKHRAVPERAVSQMGSDTSSEVAIWEMLLGAGAEESTFRVLLAQAPAEIKQVLELLAGDGADALQYLRTRLKRRFVRETTNEYLCRLGGVDSQTRDFVGEIQRYFS